MSYLLYCVIIRFSEINIFIKELLEELLLAPINKSTGDIAHDFMHAFYRHSCVI